jgi:hypothetical protein
MKGLREMRVKLSVPGLLSGGLTRRMLYESVRSVTGPDVFQLLLQSDDVGNWRYIKGRPSST